MLNLSNSCGCVSTCSCSSKECKQAKANTKKDFLMFVNNAQDLKNLKLCDEITLMDGQLIFVSSLKKYVSFDANTGNFKDSGITLGADIVLP